MQKYDVPQWAACVVSRIERRLKSIRYSVLLEGDSGKVHSRVSGLLVWEKEVRFGTVESRHAGCYAFQEASKEQDLVARQYAEEVGIVVEQYAGLERIK